MEPPNKKPNNTDDNINVVKLFKPKTEEELIKLHTDLGNYCYLYTPITFENNTNMYDHDDPYLKTRHGMYIMADCLLSLFHKDLNKCTFYDTYTIVSTFDSSVNKTIYVKFRNTYLLEKNNTSNDDVVAGLYDD